MSLAEKMRGLRPPLPVVLVDDEPTWLRGMELALRSEGFDNILCMKSLSDFFEWMDVAGAAVAVIDLNMPGEDGEDALRRLCQEHPEIPAIVLTGDSQAVTAVRCLKMGAFNYFVKTEDRGVIIAGIRHAVDIRLLQFENKSLKDGLLSDTLAFPEAFSEIVSASRSMFSIFKYMEAVASSMEPILICGESGTGKELVAKALHRLSCRKGAFVPVNVAGLDPQMFSDTLFGHVKGAYTGASSDRDGMVSEAVGGTLFLDEIGEISNESQLKMLRLIQERTWAQVGSDASRRADIRILAATNQSLESLMAEGRFRKDLYYRLCPHRIELPPLRERPEDIPSLMEHFLKEAAASLGKEPVELDAEAGRLLLSHSFPGNVRELRGLAYDVVGSAAGEPHSQLLRRRLSGTAAVPGIPPAAQSPMLSGAKAIFGSELPSWRELQHSLVMEAMKRAGDNQSLAARLIGMNRQTLNKHLKEFSNSPVPDDESGA